MSMHQPSARHDRDGAIDPPAHPPAAGRRRRTMGVRRLVAGTLAAVLTATLAPTLTATVTAEAASAASPTAKDYGLLHNAGFERDENTDGLPDGWTRTAESAGDVALDGGSARTGITAVRLTGDANGETGLASDPRRLVLPEQVYQYGAIARLDAGSGPVVLRAVFRDATGAVVKTSASEAVSKTGTWAPLTLTEVTPAEATTVSVELVLSGAGTAWLDDAWVAPKATWNLLADGAAERHDGEAPTGWSASSVHGTPLTIANPSAEQGTTSPTGWSTQRWAGASAFTWDSSVAHTGGRSLKVTGKAGDLGGWRIRDFPALTGGQYRFSVWIKGDGTQPSGAEPTVIYYDAAGKTIGRDTVIGTPSGTYDWTEVTSTLTVPANATALRIDLRLRNAGTVWYDDLSVERRELVPGVGDGVSAGWDSGRTHGGAGALTLTSEGARGEVLLASEPFPVVALERYALRGFVTTQDVAQAATVAVQYLDGDGEVIGVTSAPAVSGTSAWTVSAAPFYPPAGAVQAQATVRLAGPGRAWFDDLSVSRATVENRLPNPSAEYHVATAGPDVPDAWVPERRSGTGDAQWVTTPNTGQRALGITNHSMADVTAWSSPVVDVPGGGTYIASGHVRTHGVGGEARLIVEFLDDAGAVVHTAVSERVKGTKNWARLVVESDVPNGASRARASVVLDGRGTATFDDLALSGPRAVGPSLLLGPEDVDGVRARAAQPAVGAELQRQVELSSRWSVEELEDPAYLVNPHRGASYIFTAPAGAAQASVKLVASGAGTVRVDAVGLTGLATGSPVPVPNGGFEDGGDVAAGWSVETVAGSPTVAPTTRWAIAGERSLEYRGTARGDSAAVTLDQALPVTGGERYSLAWTVNQTGLIDGAGSQWEITFTDAAGQAVGSATRSPQYNWDTHTRWDSPLFEATQASANVYLMRGDETAARKAVLGLRYLLDESVWGMSYTLASGGRPNGEDGYGAVHFGRAMGGYAMAYDLVRDSEAMTAEDEAWIRDRLAWMQDTQMNLSYYDWTTPSGRKSNWNSDRAVGVGMAAMAMPEFTTAAEFADHAEGEISWTLDEVVLDDGAWPETVRYHVAPLVRLTPFVQALARHGGADLVNSETLKRMWRFLIGIQTPEDPVDQNAPGRINAPAIGDSDYLENPFRVLGWFASLYAETDPQLSAEMQWTWQRAGSPVRDTGVNPWPLTPLLAVDESLPAAAPTLTSTAFPNIGYDILRDDVDTDGEDYLVMSNTPAPLGHNHDDRTGFSLWGNSTPLALDSGVGGYFNGDNVWFNSASSHNVVQFRQANGTWGGTAAVAEVTDRFYSQAMDYVRVQAPPSGVQGYERHVASIKGDLDAYVVWDRIDSTLPSRFNLHTLTTSIDQHGNRLAAHGYNETDLDVHVLGVDQAQPEIGEGRVSGRWPQPHQQWIQLGAGAGQDHVTVLDPRTADGEPLTTRQIAANGEAKAFELVAADGARWIVLVNGAAAAASLDLPTDGSYTDLRSGRQLAANGGVVTADIPAHGMIVLAG